MHPENDFSALQGLLALKRNELPADTQVDQFLIEFHRRQRAQLLVPQSRVARALGWVKERVSGLELVPALSYGSAFAAIAIVAVVGLPQQAGVTPVATASSGLVFQLKQHESSFAMLPTMLTSFTVKSDTARFIPSRADSGTTRFVLANNSPAAHDSTMAF